MRGGGTSREDPTGLGLAVGTLEDAEQWIGQRHHQVADVAVSESMVRNYCALVEDGNPDYWEGGLAPPGLLMAWMMPLPWRPGPAEARTGLFAFRIPLPGGHIINVATDTGIVGPVRVGDVVEATDELASVSPLKHTRLGSGHFITTHTSFSVGERPVARNTNVLFRYDADERTPVLGGMDRATEAALARPTEPSPVETRARHRPSGPTKGDDLGPVTLDVSLHRVVLNAAATWDWFPGHHNPFYAREQGQRTVYLSTLFFHGFVDRLATDWAGPGSTVVHRRIRMQRSIYAGEWASARGQVTEVRPVTDGWEADIDAVVEGPDGPCVPARLTVRSPDVYAGRSGQRS